MAIVVALTLGAMPAIVWGNVYASGLEQTAPDTMSYVLNENADSGVTVEVWQVGGGVVHSENLGAQTKGTHSWTWNGAGSVAGNTYITKVRASDDGYGGWTKLTTDDVWNNYYSPRGVDVNKNASSPYFGRIYVAESVANTTGAGRAVQDGVYMLKADVTDADGQGNTSRTGGLTFGGANSPFRLMVGPDDNVYLTDWSDSNSSLIVGNANFTSASHALDNTGRDALGKAANHGSLSTVYVEGTGTNRVIYTMDEDYDAGTDTAHGGRGSILRYDVGDSTLPYTGLPAVQYDDGNHGNLQGNIQNYYNDMVRASDGTWWVSQERAGGTDALTSLMQISEDGSTVLWKSVPALAATSLADPVRRTRGITWDPIHDWLILATYNTGMIQIFDDDTKTILYSIQVASNATPRDIAVDAAGNIYVVDNITERLQIYSPGDGFNSFTTESWFTLIPEPTTVSILALGGLALLRRRRK